MQRGAGISVPKLALLTIQANMPAGRFGEAEADGITYDRISAKWKEVNERLRMSWRMIDEVLGQAYVRDLSADIGGSHACLPWPGLF